MKQTLTMILCMALALSGYHARAQHFNPESRNSLEISTGYAPLHTLQGVYNLGEETVGGCESFCPNINFSYVRSLNERWDLQAGLNLSGGKYDIYPRENDIKECRTIYSATASAIFRCKWFIADSVKLYTSFGVGVNPWVRTELGSIPILVPLPTITPIGINFGARKVYGISELTVGPSASVWLVGLGIRLDRK